MATDDEHRFCLRPILKDPTSLVHAQHRLHELVSYAAKTLVSPHTSPSSYALIEIEIQHYVWGLERINKELEKLGDSPKRYDLTTWRHTYNRIFE